MYQNKAEDQVVTPAHLLLIPLDSSGMANFINFKNIGLDTLQGSSAFAKIRNATKIYNSHLVHTPSSLTSKYYKLNSLFSDENDFLSTSSFGTTKQHNVASVSSLGNTYASTMLDTSSFDKFLQQTYLTNTTSSLESQLQPVNETALSIDKKAVSSFDNSDSVRTSQLLTNKSTDSNQLKVYSYPSLLENVNDNSDKSGLQFPNSKLASKSLPSGSMQNATLGFNNSNLETNSSGTSSYTDATIENNSNSAKAYNLVGPNSKILLADQSIRAYPDLTPSKSNYNLSSNVNTALSNNALDARLNRSVSPFTTSLSMSTNYADQEQVNKLASSRSFISESHTPILSSNPNLNDSLQYDASTRSTRSVNYNTNGNLNDTLLQEKAPVGEVFIGSREKTPSSINTAY